MARKIYTVYATIVNAQGNRSTPTGFPKNFDSDSYGGDVDKALKRAKSAAYAEMSEMCAVDGRMLQTVVIMAEDGFVIDNFVDGALTDTPAPVEPEEQ